LALRLTYRDSPFVSAERRARADAASSKASAGDADAALADMQGARGDEPLSLHAHTIIGQWQHLAACPKSAFVTPFSRELATRA
jgi:hypothetical protein